MIILVMWAICIWMSGNKYTHGEVLFQPGNLWSYSRRIHPSSGHADTRCIEVSSDAEVGAPDADWVKMNVDGVLDLQRGVAGACMIAWNQMGLFLPSMWQYT
jgi:hypothetical protein